MDDDSGQLDRTRAALRYLYGAASACLRGDGPAMRLLAEQAVAEVPLGDLLDAGALSVAEQLRDVAATRRMRPVALLRVLAQAHRELAGTPDLVALVLAGAAAYLDGNHGLWDVEELCQLAACPTASLEATVTVLGAALTWRARDLEVAPSRLVENVCLGLAARDVGLLRPSR